MNIIFCVENLQIQCNYVLIKPFKKTFLQEVMCVTSDFKYMKNIFSFKSAEK